MATALRWIPRQARETLRRGGRCSCRVSLWFDLKTESELRSFTVADSSHKGPRQNKLAMPGLKQQRSNKTPFRVPFDPAAVQEGDLSRDSLSAASASVACIPSTDLLRRLLCGRDHRAGAHGKSLGSAFIVRGDAVDTLSFMFTVP